MPTLIEVTVDGLACRLSREAVASAIEARDAGAVVAIDAASGHLRVETELDVEELRRAIEAEGCKVAVAA